MYTKFTTCMVVGGTMISKFDHKEWGGGGGGGGGNNHIPSASLPDCALGSVTSMF